MSEDLLRDILPDIIQSHGWMLKTIKHKAQESQGGNFSDELKHSMATQEALEVIGGAKF